MQVQVLPLRTTKSNYKRFFVMRAIIDQNFELILIMLTILLYATIKVFKIALKALLTAIKSSKQQKVFESWEKAQKRFQLNNEYAQFVAIASYAEALKK